MLMATHGALSMRRRPSSSSQLQYTYIFGLIILTSTIHVVGEPGGAVDPAAAAESLLKFKSGLENSGSLESWQPGTNPCNGKKSSWKGVICKGGQVHGLRLENMGLSGKIDMDSLEPLKATLRSLSFMNNSFEGEMPDWRKAPIKALYVSNNHFSGVIPEDAFEGMTGLNKVDLANNEFTGIIPSSLAHISLSILLLNNNKFSGHIPEFQEGIKTLNLSNNQLEGPVPHTLATFDPSTFSGNEGLCGEPTHCICKNPKSKLNALLIVVITISALIVVALLVLILLQYWRSKKESYERTVMKPFGKQNQPPRIGCTDPEKLEIKKVESNPNKLTFVKSDREEFDLHDLLKSTAEVLGSGNFGSTFKATLTDGKGFVVKRCNQMNNIDKEDFLEHMRRLGRLEHPNLLPIVAYFYKKEEKLMVFDHAPNGSLAARLHGTPSPSKPGLDWPTRLGIVKGVAKGMLYLQTKLPSLSVAHGHLKASNVVLDKNMNPRLMDYGLNPVVNMDQAQNLLVSYKSPEYAELGRIYKKTDVWCLGVLILEILTGKVPTNFGPSMYAGYDSNLGSWIDRIIKEDSLDVVDKQMEYSGSSKGSILQLLRIGAACCREDLSDRVDMEEAANMIDELNERDY